MPVLGGSSVLLSADERLAKLQASAAYGGRHVPVPRCAVVKVDIRGRARIRTLADITSKLKNETASSKAKKRVNNI